MLKKILLLGLVCVMCLGTSASAEFRYWVGFFPNAEMDGLKTVYTNTKFSSITTEITWNGTDPQTQTGTMQVKGPFTLLSFNSEISKDYPGTGSQVLSLKWDYSEGDWGTFYTALKDDNGDEHLAGFVGAAETSMQGQTIPITLGGEDGELVIPAYDTTAEQLEKGVPYVELAIDAKGFVTGGVARMVKPNSPEKALIAGTEFKDFSEWRYAGVRLWFSVDGTRQNTRRIVMPYKGDNQAPSYEDGEKIEVEFVLPNGLEGVIHKDRITAMMHGYNKKGAEVVGYRWSFSNRKNIENLAEKGKDIPIATGTDIVTISADMSGTDKKLPDTASLTIVSADTAEAAVTEAMGSKLDNAQLVKTATFSVGYAEAPDGSYSLPTVMKFVASSADVKSAVWKIVSDDRTQENILKHVRVFKIVPTSGGTAVVDLMNEVPKADWEKVFNASVEGDYVNITANIMIIDATDNNDGSGKFKGLITLGSTTYLQYMDGRMNGKFEDPIAIVAKANPEDPVDPEDPTNKSSNGCSTGYVPFALLFATPLFFRKKK